MSLLDLIISIPLLYGAIKGFKRGFIVEVFTLLALLVGLYAGIHLSDTVANTLEYKCLWCSDYLPLISFSLVFLGLGAMIYFAGKAIERILKLAQLSVLNKIGGALFGLAKAIYFVSAFLLIIASYDENQNILPKEKTNHSMLYQPLIKVAQYTIPGFEESKLFLRNRLKNETENKILSLISNDIFLYTSALMRGNLES